VPLPDNVGSLSLQLRVEGQPRQAGGVEMMIYKPAVILSELHKFTTLEDDDLVMTGTPEGVGVINKGELFEGAVLAGHDVLVSASWIAQ